MGALLYFEYEIRQVIEGKSWLFGESCLINFSKEEVIEERGNGSGLLSSWQSTSVKRKIYPLVWCSITIGLIQVFFGMVFFSNISVSCDANDYPREKYY